MKHRITLVVVCFVLIASFFGGRIMDEGMWLPNSVGKLPLEGMKKHGLVLTPDQIYSDKQVSLKDAIVLLGGGTASFVSPEGLMITNHHVAFAGIQQLSSVQDDYLKNGFWAKEKSDELSTTYTAQVVTGIADVTDSVLVAVKEGMAPEERSKAIRTRSAELEKKAKGTSDAECRISAMYSGLKYYLFTYEQILDVRMVYAPPSSIGNYGGETDNWMWPRHTGDFSLMRAYVGKDGKPAKYAKDNIPYHPRTYLPVSSKGFQEDDFAMILGFPGRTFRYLDAASVAYSHDVTLPLTVDLYKTRIDVIEAFSKKDRAVAIKYASRVRGIANTYKNFLGTLEGMRRADLVTMKREEEKKFANYLASTPELSKKYGTLLADIETNVADQNNFSRKLSLIGNTTGGVDLIRVGVRYAQFAKLFTKDTSGKYMAPLEKELASMKEFLATTYKNSDVNVDKATLVAMILKNAAASIDNQIVAFHDVTRGVADGAVESKVRDYTNGLYSVSALASQSGAEKLMDGSPETILADPAVKLAVAVDAEQSPLQLKQMKFMAVMTPLRAKYIEAWMGWKKGTLQYPDANRTLRLTYGQIKSYVPRDAVKYNFVTTLTGVMEKESTSDEEFIVPAKLKELWKAKDFGKYADPKLNDVPVAFLADLDITGGNSGSPVINGKGELIGCAFDGNWEAVVGDYYFQESLNRTIAVDARYVLFILDKFSGAQNLLKEMTIH